MARRKNTRFIDPRYFMDEKMERLDEQAPGSQIFEPGSSDELDKRGSYIGSDIEAGETSEPSAFAADAVKNLSPEELALAIVLEGVRIMARAEGQNHQPYPQYERIGAEPPPPPYVYLQHPSRVAFGGRGDRKQMMSYIRNLGLVKDGKFQAPQPHLQNLGEPLRTDRSGKGLESQILKVTYGENLPSDHYVNRNLPEAQKRGYVKPFSIKDPVSGDTFSFTPMLSESGMVHSVQIS